MKNLAAIGPHHILLSNCISINSVKLGKAIDRKGNEVFDYDDRATGAEVVEYYGNVLKKFKTNPKFRAYFKCEYQQEHTSEKSSLNVHCVRTSNGDKMTIRCRKVVMIRSQVLVPSMRKAPFPVHENVNYIPVNDVMKVKESGKYANYVIVGAGKTSLDAIIQLLKSGVNQSSIKWIISQDVWFFIRDKTYPKGKTHYENVADVVQTLHTANSVKAFFLEMEQKGKVARLDPSRDPPTVVKGPMISSEELSLLRTVKDIIRLGRVKSIDVDGVMIFDDDKSGLQEVHLSSNNSTTVFVDCMAENFFGYDSFSKDFKIYEPNRINLGPLLIVFNASFSAALVACMESKIPDNETKNACCFWGTTQDNTVVNFIESFYCQIKMITVLMNTYAPSGIFLLYSRTNSDSVIFHGGVMKLLWAQLGPRQLKRKLDKAILRIESGGFADFIPDKDIVYRPMPPKVHFTNVKTIFLVVLCSAISAQVCILFLGHIISIRKVSNFY